MRSAESRFVPPNSTGVATMLILPHVGDRSPTTPGGRSPAYQRGDLWPRPEAPAGCRRRCWPTTRPSSRLASYSTSCGVQAHVARGPDQVVVEEVHLGRIAHRVEQVAVDDPHHVLPAGQSRETAVDVAGSRLRRVTSMQSPALARSTSGSTGASWRQCHRAGRQLQGIGSRHAGRRIEPRQAGCGCRSRAQPGSAGFTTTRSAVRTYRMAVGSLSGPAPPGSVTPGSPPSAGTTHVGHHGAAAVVDQGAAERVERAADVVADRSSDRVGAGMVDAQVVRQHVVGQHRASRRSARRLSPAPFASTSGADAANWFWLTIWHVAPLRVVRQLRPGRCLCAAVAAQDAPGARARCRRGSRRWRTGSPPCCRAGSGRG